MSAGKVCPTFCQQRDSPEEEERKCPYPEEWIRKELKNSLLESTRTRATFIKEFSEAGWVRRVGLPSTYVTNCQDQTSFNIEDCGLRVGGSYGSELKCVRYGCQPNN